MRTWPGATSGQNSTTMSPRLVDMMTWYLERDFSSIAMKSRPFGAPLAIATSIGLASAYSLAKPRLNWPPEVAPASRRVGARSKERLRVAPGAREIASLPSRLAAGWPLTMKAAGVRSQLAIGAPSSGAVISTETGKAAPST